MVALSPDDIDQLLDAWSKGDKSALDNLVPMVYAELRRLASHYMRHEHSGYSLQTTALVNEAYLRLTDYREMKCESRVHFLAVAAQAMRPFSLNTLGVATNANAVAR
jgi:RNA polymerase sigma-70 factor, ECF subfamily